MKINLTVSGRFRDILAAKGAALRDAANAAVVRQTNETKGAMRVQIAQRLTPQSANALRGIFKANNDVPSVEPEVVGFVHSAWFRKSRRGGPNIDLFAAFERGDVIAPATKNSLAVPLPAAYDVVGIPMGARGGVEAHADRG